MTDYFASKEKSCKCGCGLNLVDRNQHFLQALNTARTLAGIPFKVNCMTRCPAHNKAVGGEPNSAHLRGLAVDIACYNSATRYKIRKALLAAGFRRLGTYKTFIHADMDESLPQDVEWVV